MNIGIVCFPSLGGSGISATELGIYLSRKGHQIHFIAIKKPFRLTKSNYPNIHFHQVKLIDHPLFHCQPYEFSLTNTIIEITIKYQLDILHTHYAVPHTSSAYTAKQALKQRGIDLKIITTLHGTEVTDFSANGICQPLISFCVDNSDAITAVSESLRLDALKYLDISKHIEVIHNFINLNVYKPSIKKKYLEDFGIDHSGERILVHTSNFRTVKRVHDVVKIFYEVQKKIPSKLLMVGMGPELESCRILTKELGLMGKVFFMGSTINMQDLLPSADLFVLPSEKESFGLSALEAMACGVPVLSSNVGGLPEVNIHNKTGFLADVGDIKIMSSYAIKILKDDVLLNEFRKNSREISKKFNVKIIGLLYEALYQKILNN